MAAPTAADLSSFMGRDLNADHADALIRVVKAQASAYTRGRGFIDGEPNGDVWSVILSASARLVADPTQIADSESMGPFRVSYAEHSAQWSTAELYVLNRYRERAW